MIDKIIDTIGYLLELTIDVDVLWIVLPLIIATIVMLFYFEKYKDEKPGWNTYVANSLILLFVAMILFRYIYNLNGNAYAFIDYLDKSLISLIVLIIGLIIFMMNFEHSLPEKITRHLSSPLTVNLLAYIIILRVYSNLECNIITSLSSLLLFIVLIIILNLIRIPLRRLFIYLRKMKEKEREEELRNEKRDIEKKKKEVRKEEKFVRKAKQEVKKQEREVKRNNIKELEKQKKEAIKLKKIVK